MFPGGSLEEGESPLDALIREAREEFDLKIEKDMCRNLMVYRLPYFPFKKEGVFICSITENQKLSLKEGAAMEWMDLKKIETLELGYGQKAIIPKLKQEKRI